MARAEGLAAGPNCTRIATAQISISISVKIVMSSYDNCTIGCDGTIQQSMIVVVRASEDYQSCNTQTVRCHMLCVCR